MTLAFDSTATLTSSQMRAACTDEGNNHVLVVETSSNTLRKYSLATGSQVGSNITIASSACAVSMLNSLSAVVGNFANGNIDYIELSSGYRQAVAGGSAFESTTRPQKMAWDNVNNRVLCVASTGRTFTKIPTSGAPTTGTIVGTAGGSFPTFNCIIFIGNDRYLTGSQYGEVVEIDFNLNVYSRLCPTVPNVGSSPASIQAYPVIVSMAYSNGLLLLGYADGTAQLYEYASKKLIKTMLLSPNTQHCFSNSYNGLILGAPNNTSANNMVVEYDMELRPMHVEGYIFNSTTNAILACGINGTSGKFWFIEQTAEKIHIGTHTARASTTQTLTLPNSTDWARVLMFTGSNPNAKLVVDRYMKSGTTFRAPASGTTVWMYVKIGQGEAATWGASTFNT